MTGYALRIASILIIIHSLIFVPAPISCAQDRPTEAEVKRAQEAANLFLQRLDETGDFARVIDEMYVEDFIERFLQEQIRDGEESDSSSDIQFAPGLNYKRDLLKQATIEDWRSLYIATNNFFYHILIILLNKSADDYLNGRETEDEILEGLIPPKLITLFNNHPVLKGFLDIDEDDKPKSTAPEEETQSDDVEKQTGPKYIETPEEMRSVTETLQEGLRLLLEEHGAQSAKLTDASKKAIEMKIQAETNDDPELLGPKIRVSDREYLGFSPGVRLLEIPTPIMPTYFMLTLAEMNGTQKIIWAEVFFEH